jgi:hypothetical protein
MRRVVALVTAALLAAGLSLGHVAHAAPAHAVDAHHGADQQAGHSHAHGDSGAADRGSEDHAGRLAAFCCFVVESAAVAPRPSSARGARSGPPRAWLTGLARAPAPLPPRPV